MFYASPLPHTQSQATVAILSAASIPEAVTPAEQMARLVAQGFQTDNLVRAHLAYASSPVLCQMEVELSKMQRLSDLLWYCDEIEIDVASDQVRLSLLADGSLALGLVGKPFFEIHRAPLGWGAAQTLRDAGLDPEGIADDSIGVGSNI